MKIFIDSANLDDIESALKRGFSSGITTNPSLLAKEPRSSFETHIKKIINLINKYQPGIHLSVEVFSQNPQEIIAQALRFVEQFDYPQISIKVQVGWNELETIKQLSSLGISVNCTPCVNITQAIMAARAGAKYVSLFWGRIRDGGIEKESEVARNDLIDRRVLDQTDFDPAAVVKSVRQIIDQDQIDTEIIVGSIRSVVDIRDAALAGGHIITIPPKFFSDMTTHFKTDQVIHQFLNDFQKWL